MRLNPLGERLRDRLAAAYGEITAGIDEAAAAARGQVGTLTIGAFDTHHMEIAAVLDLFQQRHPQCELRLREILPSDPFGGLRAGRSTSRCCGYLSVRPTSSLDPPCTRSRWEGLAAIGAGSVVSPIGSHAAASRSRRDIKFLPITDSPILRFAAVWRSGNETPLIRAFARAAVDSRVE